MRGGSLVLFGADAAFPHGTTKPQPLRPGDVVLIDGGGRLHGYASDITRTAVFGAPPTDAPAPGLGRRAPRAGGGLPRRPARAWRRRPWTPRPGASSRRPASAPATSYFTHRVGHGIGMDGHEWTYLVRGNTTKLRPGMCFSDEPGIYVPGELGVRHEDIIFITETGAENMTKWTGSPEDPAVVYAALAPAMPSSRRGGRAQHEVLDHPGEVGGGHLLDEVV